MNSSLIRTDIQEFEKSVKILSSEISKASSIWTDSKYSDLFASIQEIARISRDVIVIGERGCKSVDQLEKIASEKY